MKNEKLFTILKEAKQIAELTLNECEECYDYIEQLTFETERLQQQIEERDHEIEMLQNKLKEPAFFER